MNLAEREKHAKQRVNQIRKGEGLRALAKLKRGIPRHARCCTVAMSLTDLPSGRYRFTCPEAWHPDKNMERFMLDFDNGKYPHLEMPKTPIKIKYPGDRKATVIE